MKVLILGGGLAGLVHAYHLCKLRADLEITLLEGGARPGGKIASSSFSWGTIERGAELIVAKYPEVSELLRQLDLELEHPAPLEFMMKADGALQRIPRGILSANPDVRRRTIGELNTLSDAGREEAFRCLQAPPTSTVPDRPLGELLSQLYGKELSDKIVAPVFAAIHSGEPKSLSSFLYGPAQNSSDAPPALVSVRGGLSTLIEKLAEVLGSKIRCNQKVVALQRTASSWTAMTATGERYACDHLVCGLPFRKTLQLLFPSNPRIGSLSGTVSMASTASIHLVFDGPVAVPPISGYLVRSDAASDVTGVSILHQKWPTRFPGTHSVFRVFVKYNAQESNGETVRAELCAVALRELRESFNITTEPAEVQYDEWAYGVQAYHVGHAGSVDRILTDVRSDRNLSVLRSTLSGTGLADAIREATLAANILAETLPSTNRVHQK